MKPFYIPVNMIWTKQLYKLAIAISLLVFTEQKTNAQTTLAAGDIAFTGYNSQGATNDTFSFVLLKNITAGTVINFTDNGWLNPGNFRSGEQVVTWTSGLAIVAGREIIITGPNAGAGTATISGNGTSAGTCSGSMPSLSTSGDQVIAFQGTIASPTIISAIHMNVYSTDALECGNTVAAGWDPDCFDGAGGTVGNTSFSKLPTGLTSGTNAIWIGTAGVSASEEDWGVFDPTINNPPLTTIAQVRAAVNDQTNWRHADLAPNRRTNPSGATFLGVIPLPVNITSFTGKLNTDKTVSLQWKVTEQSGILQYEVEKSANGSDFTTIGSVDAVNTGSYTYTFTDRQVLAGKNYYRLKTVELSGKSAYTNVIAVTLKAGVTVTMYPNPITDQLVIQQFGVIQHKIATIYDPGGKILQKVSLNSLQQTVDMKAYSPGVYIIKLEDGTIFKVIKQ